MRCGGGGRAEHEWSGVEEEEEEEEEAEGAEGAEGAARAATAFCSTSTEIASPRLASAAA